MNAYLNTIGNPWHVLDELLGGIPYDLFDSAWRNRQGRYPRVNVWESEGGLAVQAEVAGVEPEKLDVAVDANVLAIKGERTGVDGATSEFQRSFKLPFDLDANAVKATVKNGLLTVTIPRKPVEKRRIVIERE